MSACPPSPPRPPSSRDDRFNDLKRNLPAVIKLLQQAQEDARNEEQLAAYINAAAGLLVTCKGTATRGFFGG